jgi:hypothetical protein
MTVDRQSCHPPPPSTREPPGLPVHDVRWIEPPLETWHAALLSTPLDAKDTTEVRGQRRRNHRPCFTTGRHHMPSNVVSTKVPLPPPPTRFDRDAAPTSKSNRQRVILTIDALPSGPPPHSTPSTDHHDLKDPTVALESEREPRRLPP